MLRYFLGSTMGLIISLSLFTLIGSLVFVHLEDGVELGNSGDDDEVVDEEVNDLLQSLERYTKNGNEIAWDKAQLAIENYRNVIKLRLSPLTKKNVDIWKALFYCFTIYTSIGYGNVVPDTSLGRLFTCIYALVGIPLCILTLDKVGKLVLKVMRWCAANIFRVNVGKSESLPMYLMISMMTVYMFLGFLLYHKYEKWSSSESAYFLFVTFTTIGFGDISPGDSRYFILTILYQFIGLAMMAALINVMVAKFESYSMVEDKSKDD